MSQNDEKITHSSGATTSGDYPPFHYLPLSLLRRTARQMGLGAERHSPYNYEKGLDDKDYILERLGHAFEHLQKAMDYISRGEYIAKEDHLAGVVCNVAFAMEYQKRRIDRNFNKLEIDKERL